MNIKDLPNNLQLLARKRREEESNTSLFDSEDILINAFEWGRTKEGYYFWNEVNTGKFDPYRELYPKDEWIDDYPGEYQVVADAYGNTIVAKVGDYAVSKDEGIKESCGKIDYSEINFEILDLMAARFEANKHKYPKGNMLKPIEISKLLWPVFRHWKKMMFPLDDDTETFEDHLAAIMCNCSMILDQLKLNK